MSHPKKTPIALFVYNRPRHTYRALQAIARCDRLDECQLHIFCDGPRSEVAVGAVEKTRKVAREWGHALGARIVEQSSNLGIGQSIVGEVTTLCREYGQAIVLEDDLVVSPDFLDFMLQSLDRYSNTENVYQISGHMFPVKHATKLDAMFLPYVSSWGWATWERAWHAFSWDLNGIDKMLVDERMRQRFDLGGAYHYTDLLQQQCLLDAKRRDWDIHWYWTIYCEGGLILHPRRSLTWNGGFDGSGVHCGAGGFMQPAQEVFMNKVLGSQLKLPSDAQLDQDGLGRVIEHLHSCSGSQLRSGRLLVSLISTWLRWGRRLFLRDLWSHEATLQQYGEI